MAFFQNVGSKISKYAKNRGQKVFWGRSIWTYKQSVIARPYDAKN